MNADVPRRTKTRREELEEWLPFIGAGTGVLVAVGLTSALVVFVAGHYHSITGAAFWILKWAFVFLVALALVVAVAIFASRIRIYVGKNSSIIPNLLAAFAAGFLGVRTTL